MSFFIELLQWHSRFCCDGQKLECSTKVEWLNDRMTAVYAMIGTWKGEKIISTNESTTTEAAATAVETRKC